MPLLPLGCALLVVVFDHFSLSSLQVLLADGCHLNRRTGDVILEATSQSAGRASSGAVAAAAAAARGNPAAAPFLFARVAPFERFSTMGDQGEPTLISPTVAGVAWKAAA